MPTSGTVRILAVGTCTIRASQAGNGHYNAAPNVERSFSINYVFLGFFQSVDNTIWNSVQAGSAIPVKFSLNGNQGLNIFAAKRRFDVKFADGVTKSALCQFKK
jgi:hypothetical protein